MLTQSNFLHHDYQEQVISHSADADLFKGCRKFSIEQTHFTASVIEQRPQKSSFETPTHNFQFKIRSGTKPRKMPIVAAHRGIIIYFRISFGGTSNV